MSEAHCQKTQVGLFIADKADVKRAFEGRKDLTEAAILHGTVSVGIRAFSECSNLRKIVIPETVVLIDYKAFDGCSSLKEAIIPRSAAVIDDAAFFGCGALESVIIPDSVSQIGNYAFSECSALKKAVLPQGLKEISDGLFSGCSALEKADLPDSLRKIGSRAFRGCVNLQSLSLGGAVESIGSEAFAGCRSLEAVSIPESAAAISGDAFADCPLLKRISWRGRVYESVEEFIEAKRALLDVNLRADRASENGAHKDSVSSVIAVIPEDAPRNDGLPQDVKPKLSAAKLDRACERAAYSSSGIKKAIISEGTAVIGSYAFAECFKLKSVYIPGSVSTVGSYAFWQCEVLKRVAIEKGLEIISLCAFADCQSLRGITLPEGLKKIGSFAFARSGLEEITVPDSVEYFGNSVFYGCSALKSIKWRGNVYRSVSEFHEAAEKFNNDDLQHFKADFAYEDYAYDGHSAVKAFIPEGVREIGKYAFANCDNLESIVLPESTAVIGQGAFYGCLLLKELTVPDSVAEIGKLALANCVSLKRVVFRGVCYTDREAFNRAVLESGCSDTDNIWASYAHRFDPFFDD